MYEYATQLVRDRMAKAINITNDLIKVKVHASRQTLIPPPNSDSRDRSPYIFNAAIQTQLDYLQHQNYHYPNAVRFRPYPNKITSQTSPYGLNLQSIFFGRNSQTYPNPQGNSQSYHPNGIIYPQVYPNGITPPVYSYNKKSVFGDVKNPISSFATYHRRLRMVNQLDEDTESSLPVTSNQSNDDEVEDDCYRCSSFHVSDIERNGLNKTFGIFKPPGHKAPL